MPLICCRQSCCWGQQSLALQKQALLAGATPGRAGMQLISKLPYTATVEGGVGAGAERQQAVTWLMSRLQSPACRRKPSPGRARLPTPAAPEVAVVPIAPAAEDASKLPAAKPEAPGSEASRPVTRSQAKSAVPSHPPDRSWFKALLYSSGGEVQHEVLQAGHAGHMLEAWHLYSVTRVP